MFKTLPEPLDLSGPGLILEEILDRRLVKKGNAAHLQILVMWYSIPAAAATWEDYEVLRACYPKAPAWGQAGSPGAGTVSTSVLTMSVA